MRGLYRAPYAASKGGITALTKVLAMEYGRYSIRVNAVSPGGTDIADRVTPRRLVRPGVMVDDVAGAEAYAEEMRAEIRNQQALKRRGFPKTRPRPSPFSPPTTPTSSPARPSIAAAASPSGQTETWATPSFTASASAAASRKGTPSPRTSEAERTR